MDNAEIRKRNFDAIIRHMPGEDMPAQITVLAEQISAYKSASIPPGDELPDPVQIAKYIKQLVSGFQGKRDRKPRGVGPRFARDIEGALALGPGWMDARHDELWEQSGGKPSNPSAYQAPRPVPGVTAKQNIASHLYPLADGITTAAVHHVPIISWGQSLMAHDHYDQLKNGHTYPLGEPIEGRLIALVMPDDSMQAAAGDSFPAGTTLVFDLDIPPDTGHYVLFKGPDGRAHFRKFVEDVGRRRLHPLNPRYEPLVAPTSPGAYLGVLVLAVPPPIFRLAK